jgi:hypothetical protein
MNNWAILGFDGPTICSKYIVLVVGDAITCSIVCLLVCDVWPNAGVIQHTCISSITFAHHGLDFVNPLNLIMQHSQYVLVMIKQFLKWLKLVPSLNRNSEGDTYVFLDNVFIKFGVLIKVLTTKIQNFIMSSKSDEWTHLLIIAQFHDIMLK